MESLDDIREVVRGEGLSLSTHQLERWRKAGLVGRPEREGLGRGMGTESWYPEGTTEVVIDLLQRLKIKRSLVEAGWVLWLLGHDVTPFIRSQMIRWIAEGHDLRKRHRTPLRTAEATDLLGGKAGRVLRKHFGDQFVPTAERLITEVLLGEFDGSWLSLDDDETFLRKLGSLGKGTSRGGGPDPETVLDDLREVMSPVSPHIGLAALEDTMGRITDAELRRTQLEVGRFVRLINPAGGHFGFGWLPVNMFQYWLPFRWGDSALSRQLQAFLEDPSWPDQVGARLSQIRERMSRSE